MQSGAIRTSPTPSIPWRGGRIYTNRDCFTAAPDRALLFSSHLLEDVEALCDRALLLRGGQLVGELAGDQLTQARASGQLTALVADVLRDRP